MDKKYKAKDDFFVPVDFFFVPINPFRWGNQSESVTGAFAVTLREPHCVLIPLYNERTSQLQESSADFSERTPAGTQQVGPTAGRKLAVVRETFSGAKLKLATTFLSYTADISLGKA